jgi:hypothetical protein
VPVTIRTAKPDDHVWIVSVVDGWWGRAESNAVPRLFLDHFYATSFVAEIGSKPVALLIGFVSPSVADVACVHFVGVDPEHRLELTRFGGQVGYAAMPSPPR